MMNKKSLFLLLTFTCACASAQTLTNVVFDGAKGDIRAQHSDPIQQAFIAEIDLDDDGMISIREAVANLTLLSTFGKIDTDGDGKISSAELSASSFKVAQRKSV